MFMASFYSWYTLPLMTEREAAN